MSRPASAYIKDNVTATSVPTNSALGSSTSTSNSNSNSNSNLTEVGTGSSHSNAFAERSQAHSSSLHRRNKSLAESGFALNSSVSDPGHARSMSTSEGNAASGTPSSPGIHSSSGTLSRNSRPNSIAKTNEHWERLQASTKLLFQRGSTPESIELRNDLVRLVLKSDGDAFLLLKYKELLTKGMIILREQIREIQDPIIFLDKFGALWTSYYMLILPQLQATFQPLPTDSTPDLNIRKISIIAWRDHILLNNVTKQKIEEAVMARAPIPLAFFQMLLVVESIHDGTGNESQIQSLIGLVQMPFLYPDAASNGEYAASSKTVLRSTSESSLKILAEKDAPSTDNSGTSKANPAVGKPIVVRSVSHRQSVIVSPDKSPLARHTLGRASRKSYASDRDIEKPEL